MIDITRKQITLRKAVAEGLILCRPETLERIRSETLPKGNLFDIAKAAALLGAKNTASLIPHCHPVSIDGMEMSFSLFEEEKRCGVRVTAEGKSIGRTGIEMESLTAVSVAALTIYDLLKPIDRELEISGIRLLEKKGGKSDREHGTPSITAAVLVCSDSTASGKREDKSGILIREILEKHNVAVHDYAVVPDEEKAITEKIRQWTEKKLNFIFTTGGTGLGPRDRTPDTLENLFDREAPGIAEAMRSAGRSRTPYAMLSRSTAGIIGDTIVICLPGSTNGARESLDGILPGVFHAKDMILGKGHES